MNVVDRQKTFLQVFFEIQSEAAKCLENYFDEFKDTQKFEKMLENSEDGLAESLRDTVSEAVSDEDTSDVVEIGQTSARIKLEHVEELIQNKLRAQEALQKSLGPDSKVHYITLHYNALHYTDTLQGADQHPGGVAAARDRED